MIYEFDKTQPIPDKAYDVFGKNGDYRGYCDFYDGEWYCDEEDQSFDPTGTYYSDDHDDWLRMIQGLIAIQAKN